MTLKERIETAVRLLPWMDAGEAVSVMIGTLQAVIDDLKANKPGAVTTIAELERAMDSLPSAEDVR